ncbi:hypothetical protein HY745_03685 [Candidatus Desantisbacteria bacterium]|nr:hypothetical protein [Candidatus Desantisbacteria bacterium]
MLERLVALFHEKVENKYYGKYRAIVTDNMDPKKLGRVKVKVPSLLGEHEIGWAMPCFPYGGGADRGYYMIPENDDGVWVEFEAGDISYPIWSGTWWAKDETPKGVEDAEPVPDIKMIKSKSGNIIQLDDTSGSESISIIDKSGNKVVMKSESISIIDKSENKIIMKADSIEINSDTRDLKLKGNNISIEATAELKITGATTTIEGSSTLTAKGAATTLEGSSTLTVKGATVAMEGSGTLTVKGAAVTVEGSGPVTIKGMIVDINP